MGAGKHQGAAGVEPLLIFPYNGNGREALDCLGSAYRLVAFIDDTADKQGIDAHGHLVLGRPGLQQWSDAKVLAVPGSPSSYRARRRLIEELGVPPSRFARLIHPSAQISRCASIGYNVLIMAGVVITCDTVIGNHVCVLPNSVIQHDVRIGDWTLVGSNVTIAGSTRIGENCYIGAGCSIRDGVTIGDGALLGMGSNLVRDLPAGARWIGNPARLLARTPLRSSSSGRNGA